MPRRGPALRPEGGPQRDGPLAEAERHDVVDVLRALALLGILLVNIEFLASTVDDGWAQPEFSGTLDLVARAAIVALRAAEGVPRLRPALRLRRGDHAAARARRSHLRPPLVPAHGRARGARPAARGLPVRGRHPAQLRGAGHAPAALPARREPTSAGSGAGDLRRRLAARRDAGGAARGRGTRTRRAAPPRRLASMRRARSATWRPSAWRSCRACCWSWCSCSGPARSRCSWWGWRPRAAACSRVRRMRARCCAGASVSGCRSALQAGWRPASSPSRSPSAATA